MVVFTGEPHLVLTGGAELAPAIVDRLFAPAVPTDGTASPAGDRLLAHLGSYVNTAYRDRFPLGVHLDVGRMRLPSGAIEYRTYERAINRETLACGSGAAAIAHVAQRILRVLPPGAVTLWPHRCRRRQPDAYLTVTQSATGLVLSGAPRFVCAGSFSLSSASPNSNVEEAAECQIPISA
ncbi:MAG: diaminopimelate epimerase [Thermoleophilaceae bacterium]|nr:diaminopimelate epimerase [Thermoleophilaceae bacterium]